MKGAFSLNNPLVGTVRPPEIHPTKKHAGNNIVANGMLPSNSEASLEVGGALCV